MSIAAIAAVLATSSHGAVSVAAPPPASHEQRFVLVAADADGAVVEDRTLHTLSGYLASGKLAWTKGEQSGAPAFAGCVQHCPDAFLSGSVDTAFRPEIADPPVSWQINGTESEESAGIPGSTGKTTVFAARSTKDAILVQSDLHGTMRLEFRTPDKTRDVPTSLGEVRPFVSADDASALVLFPVQATATGRSREFRWYHRDAKLGWQEVRRGTTDAYNACVTSDGTKALLIGATSQLINRDSQTSLAVPGADGDCSFSQAGPVVAGHSATDAGNETAVVQYDWHGKQLWDKSIPQAAMLSSTSKGDRVVLAGGGNAWVYGPTGQIQLSADGVDGGQLVEPNKVVLLHEDGKLEWKALS